MDHINKTIWIYWHQGWEKAPQISIRCLSSWQQKNPDWTVQVLSDSNLSDFINLESVVPGIFEKNVSLTGLSDIIRTVLLKTYGGVWVDSTLLCTQSLNSWLGNYIEKGFFAFSNPSPGRMISSWFLAAQKNNYIIDQLYLEIIAFWKNKKSTDNYFWFHHLFNYIYQTNDEVRKIFDATPKIAADLPHYFIPYEKVFFDPIDPETKKMIERINTPVFKLSYKYDQTRDTRGTVIEYLLNGNIQTDKMKILVTWYGSFKNNGTIGDYLAVKSLTHFLDKKKYDFDCACYKHFDGLKGNIVSLDAINDKEYTVIIFCCGPILKVHENLNKLFSRFETITKIGVGVSLFPKDHFNYYNPFDFVLAREHGEKTFEDIAILAKKNLQHKKQIRKIPKVGLILRNNQTEYGLENCKWEQANSILLELAQFITKNAKKTLFSSLWYFFNKRIIFIDNHLETSGLTPIEIESLYNDCDIILTTRFHGAMLSIRNGIPVIAIDQILSGGKVFNMIHETGYPFVWKVNEITSEGLEQISTMLLQGKFQDQLTIIEQHTQEKAKYTLLTLEKYLNSLSDQFQATTNNVV
ncbi:MAG: capsular polysaccharide synthesis protein [Cytophaga sp.]|uniref:capsular polysaccharide synthesis protein n=1 Tax=Cytophaga sp. TaxID=29535 RepID=UPI003F7FB6BD